MPRPTKNSACVANTSVSHENSMISQESSSSDVEMDVQGPQCFQTSTGGSHLSHTVVKPDSRLARIFVAKFLCIIKLITIIG